MSKSLVIVAVSVLAAGTFAQSFECYANGPIPLDPSLGCEGVASNGLGTASAPNGATGIESLPSCGFPTNGSKYVRLVCNSAGGGFLPPVGGPFTRPVPAQVTEFRIPIPAGATTVTMDWEFFNRECPGLPPGNSFYDGMSIDVVSPGGALIQNLVYADTASPEGPCSLTTDYCNSTTNPSLMAEVLPAGPNQLAANLPALSGCEYISVVIWNGNDNAFPGLCYIDNVNFSSAAPACPVPCFIVGGGGSPTLSFSSPSGAGCILVSMTNMPSGGLYFMPVTLAAGTFPNGWFFGVDIPFPDLAAQVNQGFPFLGGVGGTPCIPGTVSIGEFCGLPSGLPLFAVALGIPPFTSYPSVWTSPVSYTIP